MPIASCIAVAWLTVSSLAGGDLVGGLYGLSLGRMFFGESMFSTVSDGSKLAFYHLNQRLLDWDFTLIDCQMMNPHLQSLGVQVMHRDEFLRLLANNDLSKTRLGSWSDLGAAEPNENAAQGAGALCMTADSDQEAPLDFYLTPPHPCSYLDRSDAQTLFADPRGLSPQRPINNCPLRASPQRRTPISAQMRSLQCLHRGSATRQQFPANTLSASHQQEKPGFNRASRASPVCGATLSSL